MIFSSWRKAGIFPSGEIVPPAGRRIEEDHVFDGVVDLLFEQNELYLADVGRDGTAKKCVGQGRLLVGRGKRRVRERNPINNARGSA